LHNDWIINITFSIVIEHIFCTIYLFVSTFFSSHPNKYTSTFPAISILSNNLIFSLLHLYYFYLFCCYFTRNTNKAFVNILSLALTLVPWLPAALLLCMSNSTACLTGSFIIVTILWNKKTNILTKGVVCLFIIAVASRM